ncbi:unnamed protein product [Eretmochelys imbricata]
MLAPNTCHHFLQHVPLSYPPASPTMSILSGAIHPRQNMVARNESRVNQFVLSGLSTNHALELVLFGFFAVIYMLILQENTLIIFTIAYDQCLPTPMYFFLSNLSFIDVCHSSVVMPKMLADLLVERKTISFGECIAQMFFLHLFTCTEILLLTAMAYDR